MKKVWPDERSIDINKVQGTIQIIGYSKNNTICAFILWMYRPWKECISTGIRYIEGNVTIIKLNRKKARKQRLTSNWIDISKKILSKQDWDDNVHIVAKNNQKFMLLNTFFSIKRQCIY